jgi:uncharacterized protein (DUF362 family)
MAVGTFSNPTMPHPADNPTSSGVNRRRFLKRSLAAVGGGAIGVGAARWLNRAASSRAGVTILKAPSYQQELAALIRAGLKHYPAVIERARGRRVLLKPNLVEYSNARRVNTHPAVVAAAIEAFRAVGAREIVVAEGPGHQRDTEMLLEESGLDGALRHEHAPFVDLNLDSIRPVPLAANYTQLGKLWLPDTALGADLIVSLPKLKTHHWTGVTLSLKNLMGVVPGAKYGWPKNLLHWRGIHPSIVDIALALRPGFAIVDGIEGMEGDGPLMGGTVPAGVLIMGDNLAAVDATATRVMGLRPERVAYLQLIALHGGSIGEESVAQRGERIAAVRRPFKVLEPFADLRA